MRTTKYLPEITPNTFSPFHRCVVTLAVVAALCAGARNSFATAFTWTNTTASVGVWQDANSWNPVGVPGTTSDTASFAFAGTITVRVTNNVVNLGNFNVGAGSGSATINITFDLGTNAFTGTSGDSSSSSSFVLGQTGTSIVYIAASGLPGTGMLCTNAGGNPRMIVGRNGVGIAFLTNGTVRAGNLIMANSSGSSGSKVVVSGSNSAWTNNTTAVGNTANISNVAVIVSNSATFASTNGFTVGAQSPNTFCSVLVDGATLVTSNQTPTIGAGNGSSSNSVTVQNGGLWDVGVRPINLGNAAGGVGNALIIGNNGTVQNVTAVTLGASGNSLVLSGGVLSASIGVTNNAGVVSGFGTINGTVVFVGTGTLTPGVGALVGTLNVSQDVPLLSTSTTILKLDKSQAGNNDALNVSGTLTEAGTLTINNTGPALAGGDTFTLFTAGTASGDFATTNLPPLTGTLIWDTSSLHSGTISIILPPSITGPASQAVLPGSNVVISAVVTGVPVPSLQWQHDGTNLIGATTDTITINNASTNEAGTYCLIASNSGGVVTNCMSLVVCEGGCPPNISGPTDQTVCQGNNGTFDASVAGLPAPAIQWQQNGIDIPGATGTPLVLTNVQYSQDGYTYSIIASNEAGSVTNSATLHVIITPSFTQQPTNYTATVGQSASFTVAATGVPTPTYQWQKNNSNILNATNTTYAIASVQASDMANYRVVVSNPCGSINSTNAFLTILSTMSASLTPTNGASSVCVDTPLYLAFNVTPVSTGTGKIQIYDSTNSVTPIDVIDTSAGNLQPRTIGTESFFTFPVIITGTTAAIYPHLGVLSYGQTYYATVDAGTFADTNGALFVGVTSTNAWVFTVKSSGPVNPNNITVAADGSGDFCTVQGAVDSLPANNVTPTLISIRNGDYNELVDTRNKNNMTFRGQSRDGVVVGYRNNDGQNSGTHARMAFKVFGNDIAVENMTITNRTPHGGSQAEAITIESNIKRFICNNAKVASYQDTILGNTGGTQAYFKNSLIVGDTDFIWGAMNAFFTNCELQCQSLQSHVTQARTDDSPSTSNGMSFVYCQITRASAAVTNNSCDLGRTLGYPYGNVIFKHCRIDSHIANWSDPSLRDWEFDNSNLTATAAVTYNGIQLTNGDSNVVCADDPNCWLYGWAPQLAPNILTNPVSITVTAGVTATFSVAATGIPDPFYQWLLNGTNVINATANSAALVISNALVGDAGVYSVIVSNIAGTATSSNATLTVVGAAPAASFTASPTSGTEPLGVTFTDTSSGSPNITLFWDFGDSSQATNAGGSSFLHTYAAGTYTVTLTASNAFGANSTLVSNNLISVVTAFAAWQQQYFGCTGCPEAQPDADPYGKGMSNTNQFLAGLNPTNPASLFTVISTAPSGSDIVITWKTAGVRTNAVQATAGMPDGSYNTNGFADVSGPVLIGVTGDTTTNYTDVGGATNSPARYYRIRLVP